MGNNLFKKCLSKNIPDTFGVYIMKDALDNILYIGKAKDLRKRLKQYSVIKDQKSLALLNKVRKIDTIAVTNEREALILESNMIQEYLPKYNVKLKDDKRFFSLHFTKDRWQTLVLKREVDVTGESFGPYPSAKMARETQKFLQYIFPLRECSDKELKRRKRPCILYELKRCIAPCMNLCTQKEYDAVVAKAKRFLKGDCKEVKQRLKEKIKQCNAALEFEQSKKLYDMLQHLDELFSTQYVSYTKIKNFDVFSIRVLSTRALIVELNFRNHKLTNLCKHSFLETLANKTQLLSQFLRQHYLTNPLPQLVVLPFDLSEAKALTDFFIRMFAKKVKFVFPKRGAKLRMLELANKNLDVLWNCDTGYDAKHMQKVLNLSKEPTNIVALDTSYCFSQNGSAAIVRFVDFKKHSQLFFKTKSSDDYGIMRETLTRYFAKHFDEVDLLLVDGGKGQMNVALKVIAEMNLTGIDVVALAKKNHSKSLVSEKIFLENGKMLELAKTDRTLQLLQKMRDEVHRVVINFHRKQQQKKSLGSSFDDIKEIKSKKKKFY